MTTQQQAETNVLAHKVRTRDVDLEVAKLILVGTPDSRIRVGRAEDGDADREGEAAPEPQCIGKSFVFADV